VESLTKRYGMRLALDNVSFEVPEGAVTGFVGPNGSGKTTTLRILLGLGQIPRQITTTMLSASCAPPPVGTRPWAQSPTSSFLARLWYSLLRCVKVRGIILACGHG